MSNIGFLFLGLIVLACLACFSVVFIYLIKELGKNVEEKDEEKRG